MEKKAKKVSIVVASVLLVSVFFSAATIYFFQPNQGVFRFEDHKGYEKFYSSLNDHLPPGTKKAKVDELLVTTAGGNARELGDGAVVYSYKSFPYTYLLSVRYMYPCQGWRAVIEFDDNNKLAEVRPDGLRAGC